MDYPPLPLNYTNIKKTVHYKVKEDTIKSIIKYIEKNYEDDSFLWGESRNKYFMRKTIYITFFKDIEGIGYDKLQKIIRQWYNVGKESIQHNVHAIREIMSKWGISQIIPGNENE